MMKRKGRPVVAGRRRLFSPRRPDAGRRETRLAFWAAVAGGLSTRNAAAAAGVSVGVGTRWFRRSGGMPPTHLSVSAPPVSGRYLSFAEREEIALWRARGHGVCEIARHLGRAPSTISRELRRHAVTREGRPEYRASTAQWITYRIFRTLPREVAPFRLAERSMGWTRSQRRSRWVR